ncbi:probable basic-leucine zipper transcription factor S [Achroia grisella]|uniref:probable basic-leucine zipper transcription factor S n=1 Tax=Achroia grisella TaxID=688607 RepID=UPI0027D260A9|nr:probable basic-leucine zipper transcription factor S [Achroia grisella]
MAPLIPVTNILPTSILVARTNYWNSVNGANARTTLPDQQMRTDAPRYPVDRYLVESSKKFEMVNIINDDIWNPEPALKPEDEIILKRLHEMLQTTADDLKILSKELSKQHEPGVQIKSLPTPLDEEFNEKVHIEEIVNAKFNGYKITEDSHPRVSDLSKEFNGMKSLANDLQKPKISAGVQVNPTSILKKTSIRKLGLSRTNVIHIDEKDNIGYKENILNNTKINSNCPTIAYCEYSYKYSKPNITATQYKKLHLQKMPGINIRSELREQKVLQFDILPDSKVEKGVSINKNNVAFIVTQHESEYTLQQKLKTADKKQDGQLTHACEKQSIRKVSRMPTYDSSGSNNNVSSNSQYKPKTQRQVKTQFSTRASSRNIGRLPKSLINRKQSDNRSQLNLEEWKRKLQSVYGHTSNLNAVKLPKSKNNSNITRPKTSNKQSQILNNNTEYIPYSQLTLGGVRVSDIEKELSDIPNKHDVAISPILDRILKSRENSFHKDMPQKNKQKDNENILSTSDENLLQEVIDIEKTINKTLSKTAQNTQPTSTNISITSNDQNEDSYADDFEDDKSGHTDHSKEGKSNKSPFDSIMSSSDQNLINSYKSKNASESEKENPNETFIKTSNLSIKNKIDVFEFIHLVDTQDTATQSTTSQKISLKETQTSPRNETFNIQPIHNDLWPTLDPKGELEKMLILEKDFIKQLIIDEYGDFLENFNKPSTSRNNNMEDNQNNIVAFQKNTQTSPVHVKCVMTSPTKVKTRTTSPFKLLLSVDQHTSPMTCVSSKEELQLEIENEDDLGISINLSSPRFNLRLPQNSQEILSNLENCNQNVSKIYQKEENFQGTKTFRKFTISTSTSSLDGDNSSSEISSLGEVKLKKKLRRNRVESTSDTSSASIVSKYSSDLQSLGILPLKSEGEISAGQVTKHNSQKTKCRGSIGETSVDGLQ